MREPYKQERDLCTALTAYLTPLGAGLITGSGEAAAGESIDEDRLGKDIQPVCLDCSG